MTIPLKPKRIILSEINNGNIYVENDNITAESLTAPIEASAYAQQIVENFTSNVDNTQANQVGIAQVEIVRNGNNANFKFKNLKGTTGATGATGATGPAGADGADGVPGVPGAIGLNGEKGENGLSSTIKVGTTVTTAPNTFASVTNSGTESNAILNFTIPQGTNGIQGIKGDNGADGVNGVNGVSPRLLQTTGISISDAMSQNATTIELNKKANIINTVTTDTSQSISGNKTIIGNIIANGTTITPTEIGYLDGVSSGIQNQLVSKVNVSNISQTTGTSSSFIMSQNATTIELSGIQSEINTLKGQNEWIGSIASIPGGAEQIVLTQFVVATTGRQPKLNNQVSILDRGDIWIYTNDEKWKVWADIQLQVATKTGRGLVQIGTGIDVTNQGIISTSKTVIGLSNVDNTSDYNKPISNATLNALSSKANASNTVTTDTAQTINGTKTITGNLIANNKIITPYDLSWLSDRTDVPTTDSVVIYDKDSQSSTLNWGIPTGIIASKINFTTNDILTIGKAYKIYIHMHANYIEDFFCAGVIEIKKDDDYSVMHGNTFFANYNTIATAMCGIMDNFLFCQIAYYYFNDNTFTQIDMNDTYTEFDSAIIYKIERLY